jgi:hypothetical protein
MLSILLILQVQNILRFLGLPVCLAPKPPSLWLFWKVFSPRNRKLGKSTPIWDDDAKLRNRFQIKRVLVAHISTAPIDPSSQFQTQLQTLDSSRLEPWQSRKQRPRNQPTPPPTPAAAAAPWPWWRCLTTGRAAAGGERPWRRAAGGDG